MKIVRFENIVIIGIAASPHIQPFYYRVYFQSVCTFSVLSACFVIDQLP